MRPSDFELRTLTTQCGRPRILVISAFKLTVFILTMETVPVANGPSTHLPLSAAVRFRWSESSAADPKISSDSDVDSANEAAVSINSI